MFKKKLLCVIAFCVVAGCNKPKKPKKTTAPAPIEQEIPPTSITVFTHGVRLVDFLQRMPIFYNSFYCPQGLSLAKDLDKKYLLSNLQELYKTDPHQFNKETVYLFGWPGGASYKARYEAAQDLYEALLELQKRHPGLPITVFSQSHGGNMVLNLARVAEETHDTTLSIERLIICSCPVQAATAHYVHSPIFKNIYAFYSTSDFLQVIDPQGLHKHQAKDSYLKPKSFSGRRFPDDDKLFQCVVRINNKYTTHSSFIYKPFLRALPGVLKTLSTPEGRETLPHVKGCKFNDFMIRITT